MKNRILFFTLCASILALHAEPPRLTIIFIIDQFAHHELQKIKPYVSGGLKFFLNNGIIYENAYHPHGLPETAVGHSALNTGAFPSVHGIIANEWYDEHGKPIRADDDSTEQAAVIAPDGVYNYGKSSKNLMVDGLSDQYVLAGDKYNPRVAIAVSLKSHATINTSGKLGKPIWFDEKTGNFTSSKAYFNELPTWVKNFNSRNNPLKKSPLQWKLARNKKNKGYQFAYCSDYNCCADKPLIGRVIDPQTKDWYKYYKMTPFANQLVLDLAREAVNEYVINQPSNHVLLWISLSSLDYLGHYYGPDTIEITDLLYHLDKQLNSFIKFVCKKIGAPNVLFALTADHGVSPTPEFMKQRGYSTAMRINPKDMIAALNKLIAEKHGVENLIYDFQPTQFYFRLPIWNEIPADTKKEIYTTAKEYLRSLPYIKNAWSYDELNEQSFNQTELEFYLKEQLYPGRSGQLFYLCTPYTLITEYPRGTAHDNPYTYNTHIPLIIYQAKKYEHTTINDKVWGMQLPGTFAQIIGIPKPSASKCDLLPGIFSSNT